MLLLKNQDFQFKRNETHMKPEKLSKHPVFLTLKWKYQYNLIFFSPNSERPKHNNSAIAIAPLVFKLWIFN